MSKRFKVSDLTLRHEIDVGSIKAAFHRASREQVGVTIGAAITWPRMLRFRARPSHQPEPVQVSPDGFIQLMQQGDAATTRRMDFFIEIDRSTESIGRIVERMQAYVAHFTIGGYAKRHSSDDAKAFPFRVLWTFRTQSRMENFLRACRKHAHPVLKMAWAASHEAACNAPFAAIWRRPVDPPGQQQALIASTRSASGSTSSA